MPNEFITPYLGEKIDYTYMYKDVISLPRRQIVSRRVLIRSQDQPWKQFGKEFGVKGKHGDLHFQKKSSNQDCYCSGCEKWVQL
jgi:hypothetical protein